MGPPMLVIVNVAERSLLQATPKPRYGSGRGMGELVGVGVGVKVLIGAGVFVMVGVNVAGGRAQVASALATPVPG